MSEYLTNYFSFVPFYFGLFYRLEILSLEITPTKNIRDTEDTSHLFLSLYCFLSFHKARNTSVRIVFTHKMDKLDIPDLAEKHSVPTSIFRIKCIRKNYI